ncbi:MAG TPA: hypothetical protein VE377_15585 [Candidatus Dormibacteraeota bacterium]|nr:hypothetical protein [Candidatus Dormibacteraeota bacterium]
MYDLGDGSNWLRVGWGACVGVIYGAVFRSLFLLFPDPGWIGIMTVGFILFTPFAMGFITVFIVERRRVQPIWTWFLYPWLPVAGGLAGAGLFVWEGLICIAMFAPIAFGAATLGGVAAGLIARMVRSRAVKNGTLACVACLPLLISPIERQFLAQRDLRSVESVIDIKASPATVWKNIERVPAIRTSELQPSWSHAIGFPNPVEATLSREGVGGVRNATFEGGVLFIETVDTWEPEHHLGFSIRAQTDKIPKTTLDEHVTVGGEYFDVLHGDYELEQLPNGEIRLHLRSLHRVSTDLNWYAHLWTDAVMADLQRRILHVVKARCESAVQNQP